MERKLNEQKIDSEDMADEGSEYPFPIAEGALDAHRAGLAIRTTSSETIRPSLLRTIESEPSISRHISTASGSDEEEFPVICHSPKFEAFKQALLPPILDLDHLNDNNDHGLQRQESPPKAQIGVTTNAPEMWKPPGLSVVAPCASITPPSYSSSICAFGGDS